MNEKTKVAIQHLRATVLGAIGGVCVFGYGIGIIVWFLTGDNPDPENPILKIYDPIWVVSPYLGAALLNYRVFRNRQKKTANGPTGDGQ